MTSDPAPKRFGVVDSLDLVLEPVSDGIRFQVQTTAGEGQRTKFSVITERDFFTSQQKRARITNNATEALPDTFDTGTVEDGLKEIYNKLDANAEKSLEQMQAPEVKKVLAAVEEVSAFRGDTTEFRVETKYDGHTATLTFTAGEWSSNSAHPLVEQWAGAYLETLGGLNAEKWETIRDSWEDDLTVVREAGQTTEEIVADQVIQQLKTKAWPPIAEKHYLPNEKTAAVYDEDGKIANSELDEDDRVVWVRNGLVLDCLSDAGKGTDYSGQLSQTLQEKDQLLAPSSRHRIDGDRFTLYPFSAEALNVEWGDVVERDDEPDEVDP